MRARLLAAGLGAYAVALIAMAPATWFDTGLQRASDGRLRLAEARGTLWSGSGQLEIRSAIGHTGWATHLAWHLQPGALLHARLTYAVALAPGEPPFPVTISWSRIELAHADIRLPVAALGLGVPRLAPLELTGEVQLRIPSLSIGRGATQGSATLQWRDAGSALSPVSPLGDYALHLAGDGPVVRFTLDTQRGPLQLDGKGSWANGHPPEFRAIAHLAPRFEQRLAPFLRLIAVERGDGSFELQFR
jgi:general secretion pathway protein N